MFDHELSWLTINCYGQLGINTGTMNYESCRINIDAFSVKSAIVHNIFTIFSFVSIYKLTFVASCVLI